LLSGTVQIATLTAAMPASASISSACLRIPGFRHSQAAPATSEKVVSITIERTTDNIGPAIADAGFTEQPVHPGISNASRAAIRSRKQKATRVMSIFGRIKDAIFGKPHATAAPPPTIDTTQAPGAAPPIPQVGGSSDRGGDGAPPVIDVENHLDSMPGADNLNWRTSIVDLMKLVGIDSDYESRTALAQEMGRSDYSGSAEDNVWLHKQVMAGLASHGGKVPTEFLD